jgi:hypothetical protein
MKHPTNQRHQLHIPAAVCTSGLAEAEGYTDYISSSDVSFSLSGLLFAHRGEHIAFFLRLPKELTGGNRMLVQGRGKVVNVQRRPRIGVQGLTTVTATIDRYEFMADELSSEDKLFQLRPQSSTN